VGNLVVDIHKSLNDVAELSVTVPSPSPLLPAMLEMSDEEATPDEHGHHYPDSMEKDTGKVV